MSSVKKAQNWSKTHFWITLFGFSFISDLTIFFILFIIAFLSLCILLSSLSTNIAWMFSFALLRLMAIFLSNYSKLQMESYFHSDQLMEVWQKTGKNDKKAKVYDRCHATEITPLLVDESLHDGIGYNVNFLVRTAASSGVRAFFVFALIRDYSRKFMKLNSFLVIISVVWSLSRTSKATCGSRSIKTDNAESPDESRRQGEAPSSINAFAVLSLVHSPAN